MSINCSPDNITIRWLGTQNYLECWQAMQQFTNNRTETSTDELWLLEHPPVYTQGQNGKAEHLLKASTIPVVKTDRGGQITYHGPGQLMVYTLIDIKRKKFNVRQFVSLIEKSIIDYLESLDIPAHAKLEAPGVYIDHQKICSIGLRIRRGYAYHGIAFNVNMDLEPFTRINPCGFAQLKMTQLVQFNANMQKTKTVAFELANHMMRNLLYTQKTWIDGE